jgi:hypothetical protein
VSIGIVRNTTGETDLNTLPDAGSVVERVEWVDRDAKALKESAVSRVDFSRRSNHRRRTPNSPLGKSAWQEHDV